MTGCLHKCQGEESNICRTPSLCHSCGSWDSESLPRLRGKCCRNFTGVPGRWRNWDQGRLSTCPRIFDLVTTVAVTWDKSLNTISGLGTEKLHLEENKLNCLIVKLQRPKVLIFCPDYFFSDLSQLYLFFLMNLTSQLPRGWHAAGSRFVWAETAEPKENPLAGLTGVTAW